MKLFKTITAILIFALIITGCSTGAPAPADQGASPSSSPAQQDNNSGGNNDGQVSGKTIKIGNIIALTGRAASLGHLQKIAIELAVEDINNSGGINGSPLEVIFEDDQLSPQQSVTLYRKLVNDDDVVAVIGPMSGGSWETVTPLANQFEVPTINVTALKPGITKLPWALRIHTPDDHMIPEGVKKFKEHYPDIQKVVIIGDMKEASGAAGMLEFEKAAKEAGLEVLDRVGYQTGATDFSAAITKVKSYNPDAVFVSSLLAESLGAAKEMERQGFDVPILVSALTWVGVFPNSSETAGKNWHTIGWSTNEVDPAVNPKMAEFNKRFLEKSQSNSAILQPANIANNSLPYDAITMIADVLRKANVDGNTPVKEARQKLRDSFVQIKNFEGLNNFSVMESGDGYIASRVLKLDVDKKMWVEME